LGDLGSKIDHKTPSLVDEGEKIKVLSDGSYKRERERVLKIKNKLK